MIEVQPMGDAKQVELLTKGVSGAVSRDPLTVLSKAGAACRRLTGDGRGDCRDRCGAAGAAGAGETGSRSTHKRPG